MKDIKDGDVFRWYYKDDTAYRARSPNGTAYWCLDNQCVFKDGELYDTYWNLWPERFSDSTKFIDMEKVDLEFVCNLFDIDYISKWQIEDYDNVYNLSSQKGCHSCYAIDKGVQPSNKALLVKYKKNLESALYDKSSAERRIESLIKDIAKLEALL